MIWIVPALTIGCAAPKADLQRPDVTMPKRLEVVGASASGQESDDVRAMNAFDGDAKTRWSSPHADHQWLVADLGSDRTVIGVKLVWEAAFGEEYRVEGSLNNEDWSKLATVRGGDGEEDQIEFRPAKLRYLRINCVRRGTEYGFSLYEVQVWGF